MASAASQLQPSHAISVRHQNYMNRINWSWFSPGLILVAYGCFAIYSGEVYIYERYGEDYTIRSSSDKHSYWLYTFGYIHMGIGALFFSYKSCYPINLQSLMSFNSKSNLSISQVAFIISLASALLLSSFYFAGLLSNA